MSNFVSLSSSPSSISKHSGIYAWGLGLGCSLIKCHIISYRIIECLQGLYIDFCSIYSMLIVSQFISWFALPWTKKNVLCIFKWFMRLWWRWSWLDFSFDSDDTVDWERKCKAAVKRNHKSCKMKALCNHLMILSLPSPIQPTKVKEKHKKHDENGNLNNVWESSNTRSSSSVQHLLQHIKRISRPHHGTIFTENTSTSDSRQGREVENDMMAEKSHGSFWIKNLQKKKRRMFALLYISHTLNSHKRFKVHVSQS